MNDTVLEHRRLIGISLSVIVLTLTGFWYLQGSPTPKLPAADSARIEVRVPAREQRPEVVALISAYLQNDFTGSIPAGINVFPINENIVIFCHQQQCAAAKRSNEHVLFTQGEQALARIRAVVRKKF